MINYSDSQEIIHQPVGSLTHSQIAQLETMQNMHSQAQFETQFQQHKDHAVKR